MTTPSNPSTPSSAQPVPPGMQATVQSTVQAAVQTTAQRIRKALPPLPRTGLDLDALTDRQLVQILLLLLGAAIIIIFTGFKLIDPPPPSHITILAGPRDSDYYAYARQYQALFAKHDIKLDIRVTTGSEENLALLQDDNANAQIAFIQSGIIDNDDTSGDGSEDDDTIIQAVASLYHEPIWIFYRQAGDITRLAELRGKRIAIDKVGSGIRTTALQLLELNGVDRHNSTLLDASPKEALADLRQGKVDAVFIIASADSDLIRNALSGDLKLVSFSQADAYVRRYPWLSKVVLPRGAGNLERDYPPQDASLLAPTANLVVRTDLHPAITYLMLDILSNVHRKAGMFQNQGEFPSEKSLDLPQSEESKRYFASGRPFLQRYLPFWVANRVERAVVTLVPLLAILLPLLRIIPRLIAWRKRAHLSRIYGQLKEIEMAHPDLSDSTAATNYAAALDVVEQYVNELKLPLKYGSDLYTLREHIGLLRKRLA